MRKAMLAAALALAPRQVVAMATTPSPAAAQSVDGLTAECANRAPPVWWRSPTIAEAPTSSTIRR